MTTDKGRAMSKDIIQETYMRKILSEHGWKKQVLPTDMFIAITGTTNEDSIGRAIYDKIYPDIFACNDDVVIEDFDFKEFNGLVMCHGYTYMDWLENISDEEIQKIIDVNLFGSIRLIKQFVRHTIDEPYRKKIISIGSMAHNKILNGSAAYCASKAGLNMFIRCAAWELAPKGYDVYIIHPSNVVDTPMARDTIKHLMRYRNLTEIEANAYWSANNPRETFLTKEEIVRHVEYILRNDVEYLSGCPIELAGGQR
jgi:NAD(P)-dependent dehydrogenase (short-subunit alcohol dehydrogenase family)